MCATACSRDSLEVASDSPFSSGRRPAYTPFDVVAGERRLEHRVDVVEQVVDVARAGRRVGLVQLPVGVGGADDPVPAPRDDEQHRLLGAQDQAGVRADPVPRHDQVDALAGPHVELAALPGQRLRVVGPDAGGVDHLPRVDPHGTAGLEVLHDGAAHALALTDELRRPGSGSRRGRRTPLPCARGTSCAVRRRPARRSTAGRRSARPCAATARSCGHRVG